MNAPGADKTDTIREPGKRMLNTSADVGAGFAGTGCDPITLELIQGAMMAAVGEMEALIERTAMSPFIREKKDFHAGIYTGDGRLVATSALAGASGGLIEAVLDVFPRDTLREGDIYWYNDCYGSKGVVTHTPDQVFIIPVFSGAEIVAWVEGWAHFNDVGGMRPGSLSSDCTDIYQEGIIIPPVRLAREGVINDDLLRIFYRNSRFPEMIQGDVRALLAAVRLGQKRLKECAGRFRPEILTDAFNRLIDRTAGEARRRFGDVFQPGEYNAVEAVDSDGQGNGPFRLRYRLEVSPGRVLLDTSATDDQSPGPINFLMGPKVAAATLGDYLIAGDRRFMHNSGIADVVDETLLRPGSLLQPHFPAPLGYRGVTLMRHISACLGLVARATGGQSNASHSAYVIYYVRGKADDGSYFLMSDGVGVGYGARPYADGNDAIYLPANENYPCEFVEHVYPMRVLRYEINPDTGGAGRWRGGCGVIREIEVLAPEAMLSVRIDSIVTPPWGVNGGMAALPGGCVINPGMTNERVVPGISDGTMVYRGDIIRIMTGGGGGWGHPYDREAERVLEDVLGGFLTRPRAEADYGVVFTADGRSIDAAATAARRAVRPPTRLFHQGQYQDELE